MKTFLVAGLLSFALSLAAGVLSVPLLRKLKAGQPILKYVKEHENKSGTPTMGGLFFLPAAICAFFAFGGGGARIATVAACFGGFYMLVGFLDDFLKIKLRHNEGLKPYQKIVFQSAIALLGGAFAYYNGLTELYVPFAKKTAEVGAFIIVIVFFVFVAMTNSVNLTDGLDGLCGGVSVCYALFFALIVAAETGFGFSYVKSAETDGIILFFAAIVGATAGFLMFNAPKARVFMGDTGSLGLGGTLCALSVFSGNALFIPIVGAAYVWSSLSVIIQVAHFKRTGKRVFLMSPFHHHLQMKGFTETQIGIYYSVFTVIIGAIAVIFYL